jgi:catechol 2,3-dioxygenase-like lactoylglutathione lyase family enzyme
VDENPVSGARPVLSISKRGGKANRLDGMARLDALGVVVSDMARAVAFYRRLGLEFEAGAEDQPHTEAATPGGVRFMLDTEETVQSFSAWSPPTGGSPRVALAFLCDGPSDVDRLHGELVEAGGTSHVEPFDAPWGQRYATVHDPDGNPVDLFAPL